MLEWAGGSLSILEKTPFGDFDSPRARSMQTVCSPHLNLFPNPSLNALQPMSSGEVVCCDASMMKVVFRNTTTETRRTRKGASKVSKQGR